jgi:hypothetical protein
MAFVGEVVRVLVVFAVVALLPNKASAVTLSYDYSGMGNLTSQSDTTLNLGGTCASPCVISALMIISGTGPAPGATSGWATTALATITDNLGQNLQLGVNAGDVGTNNNLDGGTLFPTILPSTLDISTSSLASIFGGPGSINYSINITLPAGAYVTPLPASLPLFAAGFGALMLIRWRKKQRALAV